jgi:polysaccharide biosynthesis protein PslH
MIAANRDWRALNQPAPGPGGQSRPAASDGPLHVVIVDEEFPYPLDSGKRIRTANLILPLAARHRITYLAYRHADPQETVRAVEFLRSQGIETVVVPRTLPAKSGVGFYARLLLNLLSRLPYSVQAHDSAALRRAIRDYAGRHEVDLWQCEWTPYAASLPGLVHTPWIVVAHNIESRIWQRYYETEPNPVERWYIKQQWRKFQRFERRVFAAAGRTIAVSDNDAGLASGQFGASSVSVVENGVDIGYFCPDATVRDRTSVLFLGSLDWRPNLDAVQALLDPIFPQVLAREDRARLVVVGRRPPRWLRDRVRRCRNVELHADVADVRPFLRQCGVMIVPLRIGGGSRLKILEALATECPVISTAVGAEGLRLTPGRHFVLADAPEDLAAAMVQAMRDPELVRRTARLGRRVVVARYDWSALSAKLETIWREQANGGNGGRDS